MTRLLCITDIHMNGEGAVNQVIDYLKIATEKHTPDLIICLGDLFDDSLRCEQLGPIFRYMAKYRRSLCGSSPP